MVEKVAAVLLEVRARIRLVHLCEEGMLLSPFLRRASVDEASPQPLHAARVPDECGWLCGLVG